MQTTIIGARYDEILNKKVGCIMHALKELVLHFNLIALRNCPHPRGLDQVVFKQVSLWAKKSVLGFPIPYLLKNKRKKT